MGSWDGDDDYSPPNLGFVTACPGLTELTVIYPSSKHDAHITAEEAGIAHSAISELGIACKVLPDFSTLQIVYFPVFTPSVICPACREMWCQKHWLSTRRKRESKERMKGLKDWAIDCLKGPAMECREGEGRTRTTLRLIKLNRDPLRPLFFCGSVKIEEYEV